MSTFQKKGMRRLAVAAAATVSLLTMSGVLAAPASALNTYSEFTASDAGKNARFGTSVAEASDGLTSAVGGQYRTDSSGTVVGPAGVYIYGKSGSTWTQTAEVFASDGANNDVFGNSIALSSDGNTLAVGAYNATVSSLSGAGAVYIFQRTGGVWTQITKLVNTTPIANAEFGDSVSLSADGTKLVVGAPLYGTGTVKAGGAFFYGQSGGTWSLNTSTSGIASVSTGLYGVSVTMSPDGSAAAVGMPLYSFMSGSTKTYSPKVFLYTSSGTTWGSGSQLSYPGGNANVNFGGNGMSFSTNGGILTIGADGVGVINTTSVSGAAFVYTKSGSTWGSPFALYKPLVGTGFRQFGESVAVSPDGSTILTGMPSGNSSGNTGGGVAFLWTKNTSGIWTITNTLTATDTLAGDHFANASTLAAGQAHPLIGAPIHANGTMTSSGSAYAFDIS